MAYERTAASFMARYGGRIDRVIRNHGAMSDPSQPFEVHIVSFPNEQAFARYRTDPDVERHSAARAELILRTSMVSGQDVDAYE